MLTGQNGVQKGVKQCKTGRKRGKPKVNRLKSLPGYSLGCLTFYPFLHTFITVLRRKSGLQAPCDGVRDGVDRCGTGAEWAHLAQNLSQTQVKPVGNGRRLLARVSEVHPIL